MVSKVQKRLGWLSYFVFGLSLIFLGCSEGSRFSMHPSGSSSLATTAIESVEKAEKKTKPSNKRRKKKSMGVAVQKHESLWSFGCLMRMFVRTLALLSQIELQGLSADYTYSGRWPVLHDINREVFQEPWTKETVLPLYEPLRNGAVYCPFLFENSFLEHSVLDSSVAHKTPSEVTQALVVQACSGLKLGEVRDVVACISLCRSIRHQFEYMRTIAGMERGCDDKIDSLSLVEFKQSVAKAREIIQRNGIAEEGHELKAPPELFTSIYATLRKNVCTWFPGFFPGSATDSESVSLSKLCQEGNGHDKDINTLRNATAALECIVGFQGLLNGQKAERDSIRAEQDLTPCINDKAALEENVTELSSSNKALRKNVTELSTSNELLQKNVTELRTDNEVLQKNVTELRTSNKTCNAELSREREGSEAARQYFENERTGYRYHIGTVQKALGLCKEEQVVLAATNRQCEEDREREMRYKIDYETLNDSHVLLQGNHTDLDSKYKTLNDSHVLLQGNHTDLDSKYKTLNDTHVLLQGNYTDLGIKYKMLNDSHVLLQGNHTDLDSKYKTLNDSHVLLQGNHTDLGIKYKMLNDTHVLLQGNHTDLDSKYKTLNDSHVLLQGNHTDLGIKYKMLNDSHVLLQGNHTDLDSKYKTLNDSHVLLQGNHTDLGIKYKMLNDSHVLLQGNHTDLDSKYKTLNDSHVLLQGNHTDLDSKYKTLNDTHVLLKQNHSEELDEAHRLLNKSRIDNEQQAMDWKGRHGTLAKEHAALNTTYTSCEIALAKQKNSTAIQKNSKNSYKKDREKCEDNLKVCKQERKDCRSDFQTKKGDYTKLQDDHRKLNDTYVSLQDDHRLLKQNHSEELDEAYRLLNGSSTDKEQQAMAWKGRYGTLESEHAALNITYTACEIALAKQKNLTAIAKDSMESYKKGREKCEPNLKVCTKEHKACRSGFKIKEDNYTKLQNDYRTLNDTYVSLQGNHTMLNATYEVLLGLYSGLNIQYRERENLLKNWQYLYLQQKNLTDARSKDHSTCLSDLKRLNATCVTLNTAAALAKKQNKKCVCERCPDVPQCPTFEQACAAREDRCQQSYNALSTACTKVKNNAPLYWEQRFSTCISGYTSLAKSLSSRNNVSSESCEQQLKRFRNHVSMAQSTLAKAESRDFDRSN